MTSALVAVRELQIHFKHDVFRVELGMPRSAAGIVFLLRDNGNVVHGNALSFGLREHGFGTAVCHLLTEAERQRAAAHRRIPVCTELLARRLIAVVDAVGEEADFSMSAAGIAASGTAAAAALRVAALRPRAFDAIACRRAKFDSVRSLEYVRAATLFLAVAGDLARIRPMTRAYQQLQCAKRFEIVQGGSPAFDDECSFRLATELTAAWMQKHIGPTSAAVARPRSTEVSERPFAEQGAWIMRMKDVMSKNVVSVAPTTEIAVARERLRNDEIDHLVVVEGKRVVGVVAGRDILRMRDDRPVSEVMSRTVATIEPEATLRRAAGIMRGRAVGCLPVVDDAAGWSES